MPTGTATAVIDLELSNPLPPDEVGLSHTAAQVLLRLHGRPLGFVPARLTRGRVNFAALVPAILESHASALAAPLVDRALAIGSLPKWPEVTSLLACRPNTLSCTPSVTVVIRADGSDEGRLRACVASVHASEYPSLAIVVGDGGADETQLLAQADGDVVAVIDETVMLDRGWIGAVVHGLVSDPDVAVVTGLTLPRSTTVALADPVLQRRWHRGEYITAATAAGAPLAAAFWRDALHYCVAPDIAGRIQDLLRAGQGVLYEPSALAWHECRMSADPCVDGGADVARLAARRIDLGQGPRAITDATSDDAVRIEVTWDGRPIGAIDLAHHGSVVSAFRIQDAVARQLAFEVLDAQLQVGAPALRAILTAELAKHLLTARGRLASGATAAPCPVWVEQRPAAA